MGILRSDRVSGLGGANAINGSVNFGGDLGSNGNYLAVGDSDDFNFGSGDFTIECWVYADSLSTNNFEGIVGQWPQNGANALNSWVLEVVGGDLEFYYCYNGANIGSVVQGAGMTHQQWNHVMVTRSGNTMYMFHNGSLTGSGTAVTATFNDVSADVTIGGNINSTAMWNGNISNLRIIKGRALYTDTFTPPSTRLTKTSDTVLLCCQSPGDVTQEETGKIITPKKSNINNSFPVASRRSPDKYDGIPYSLASSASPLGTGEDHGTTFADNTKFDTLSYMVPPGGTTVESNRGRGAFAGGETPSKVNSIEYINIQSMGTSKDFGDLTVTSGDVKGLGSSTRGVFRVDNNPSSRNVLEYITFATTSNATDFGDLVIAVQQRSGASNQTRGIFSGGLYPGSTTHNDMDYITIASTGNAADFGNLSVSRADTSALASPTRMVVAGGVTPGPTYHVDVDYVTIATTGNAADFGDLNTGKRAGTAVANSTRGVFGPGRAPSVSNVIDYITIASTGNATDFGDALLARGGAGSASNSIRGLFAGGYTPTVINGIEFITIATTGNGADFGDMTFVSQYGGGCSDSHGGIS